MTKHLVRLKNRLRTDSGQGALEYVGILAVVAIVIGLVIAAFQAASGSINAGVVSLIDALLGTGG